jgi:hypothetical protein
LQSSSCAQVSESNVSSLPDIETSDISDERL